MMMKTASIVKNVTALCSFTTSVLSHPFTRSMSISHRRNQSQFYCGLGFITRARATRGESHNCNHRSMSTILQSWSNPKHKYNYDSIQFTSFLGVHPTTTPINMNIIHSSVLHSSSSSSSENDAEEYIKSSTPSLPSFSPNSYSIKNATNVHSNRYLSTTTNTNNNDPWITPKTFPIPEDQIEFTFTRSSGAGGQNVNKVNTQVTIRFHLMDATWIPFEVRQRMFQNDPTTRRNMNKDGILSLSSQEYRTQIQNRKDVLDKLEQIILMNYPRPKVRKLRKGISQAAKERNKEDKRFQSKLKENRRKVDF